jgi:hypothetical protein
MELSMKRKRLDGTVLILVVAFMLILIVFCMATLAMVSTANTRAITKFEENQSYFTAASALEIFASGTLKDSIYYATKTPGGTTPREYISDAGVPVPKMSQGRALELDLYKIVVMKSSSPPPDQDPLKGNGKNGDTTNFFTGTNSAFNLIINATTNDFFTDPSTPHNNYAEQFTVKDPTTSGTAGFKYAEYTMALPGISSGGVALGATDNYGLFADSDTGSVNGGPATGTIYPVKITVEVIERYYNMAGVKYEKLKKFMDIIADGDASTVPTADEAEAVSGIFDPSTYVPGNALTYVPDAALIKAAIRAGDRHKDYFRIRVTAETTLLGVKGTTAREFVIYELPDDNYDSSNTSAGGIGNSGQNTAMNITGGAASMDSLNMVVPGQIGPFYSEKDFFLGNSGPVTISAREYVFAKGHIIIGNSGGSAIETNGNAAFIYGGQGIYVASSTSIGYNVGAAFLQRPITVITGGSFDYSDAVTVNGNIIADSMQNFYYPGPNPSQAKLTVTGDVYVNDYYSQPDVNSFSIEDTYNSFKAAGNYPGVPGSYANALNAAHVYVHSKIILGYNAVPIGGVSKQYLAVGDEPLICNSTTEVWSLDGLTNYGTVGSLLAATTGFALKAGDVIEDITNSVPQVKVDYWADSAGPSIDEEGRIMRMIELPIPLDAGEPDNYVHLPTTQSRFNKMMYEAFFTADGDLATDSTGATSAWNPSISWGNIYDADYSGLQGNGDPQVGTYNFSRTVTISEGETYDGTYPSHFGGGLGAYPDAAILAAQRTAEADYRIKNNEISEGAAAADSAFYSAHFNLHSSYATVVTGGKSAYTYSFPNGSETITCSMPAGSLIKSSGIFNGSGGGVYYIDANDDEIELQLEGGSIHGTYIILGKKKVNILIPGSGTFAIGGGGSFLDTLIMRDKVYAMLHGTATIGGASSAPTFRVGEMVAGGVKEASIGNTYIYVSSDVDINYGGANPMLAAVIIAHQSEIDITVTNGYTPKVDYNNIIITPRYFCTMGSVLSNHYNKTFSGMAGNLFVSTETPPDDGEPNFNWNSTRYLSGAALD